MSQRNHVKLLSDEEREMLNHLRKIKIMNNMIYVTSLNINRTVIHPINEPFDLVFKDIKTNRCRKIRIIPGAINLWMKEYQNTDYTLIDIQQALNILSLQNDELTESFVKEVLKQL